MKKPRFGPLLIALTLLGTCIFLPTSLIVGQIDRNKTEQAATSLDPIVFKGTTVQEAMLKDERFLPIYGSSELSRLDPYHPSNYFYKYPAGFTPFLIGRGGSQSLIHYLNIASVGDALQGKKVVVILSPQWFKPKGITENHFAANFSKLHAYRFLRNEKIDEKAKANVAKRLLKFKTVKEDSLLTTVLNSYAKKGEGAQWQTAAAKSLLNMQISLLEKKDAVNTLLRVRSKNLKARNTLKENLSWKELTRDAETYGRKHSRNNQWGIEARYYKKHKQKIERRTFKNNASYAKSPEYKDLQLMLDLFKALNVDALFISIPVNGPWYDQAGFPKQGRTTYYAKVRKQITSQGFKFADYSKHEYDSYFLCDPTHLGWKGWMYVNRDLEKFYKNEFKNASKKQEKSIEKLKKNQSRN
ncbi:D-alanyl-lipoteichoic acid biosynthesis protein DltD [Numidum massiliense]|uniref:D-alanyl-lipoteichoic acid biosynthesis protein DltD n=1 Tax=Numidum massiliense TaxID=1522315 RepID=UPI0006D56899|nr:D-alanyl-lipoteichoic acid biosynthesis protein DltD [Numidum massiliense]